MSTINLHPDSLNSSFSLRDWLLFALSSVFFVFSRLELREVTMEVSKRPRCLMELRLWELSRCWASFYLPFLRPSSKKRSRILQLRIRSGKALSSENQLRWVMLVTLAARTTLSDEDQSSSTKIHKMLSTIARFDNYDDQEMLQSPASSCL
jgi:hypothetical protein